jgi:hypothetical protein
MTVVALDERRATEPEVSIVVPAYDEARRLPLSIPPLLEAIAGLSAELIVVDDGSRDGTAEVAAELLRGTARPLVVRHVVNRGKGAAVRSGVALASGRKIVFMDADLATDLRHLDEVLEMLDEVHLAVGSRAAAGSVVRGNSTSRAYMGRTFNQWARLVTGVDVTDFQCGFKGFRAPAAKVLFSLSQVDGFAFDVEILTLAARIGYRTHEFPVHWEAVEGSHVRPLHHAPRMALSAAASGLRWTPRRSLAAIRAATGRRRDPDAAVAALAHHLPASAQVVPVKAGALAVLPFVDGSVAAREADRTQLQLPEYEVASTEVPAWELLSPGGRTLRIALAAA